MILFIYQMGKEKLLYVNDAYTRVTGIPKSAVIGKYVRDLDGKIYKETCYRKSLKSRKKWRLLLETV